MKTDQDIKQKIEAALNSADAIEEVKVSPFLKEKTLNRIYSQKKEKESQLWSWFTPQLQLAALLIVVAVNVYALMQFRNSDYDNEISNFAESYGLFVEDSESIIN